MILADEINRTPPKTQAALLEAMQERQVTVGRIRHKLSDPFFVLATQNPIEQEGTYPLPEAQQDRFMFKVFVRYPSFDEELEIARRTTTTLADTIEPVLTGRGDRRLAADGARGAGLGPRDPLRLVAGAADPGGRARRSRFRQDQLRWGAGPRAVQFLILGAKSRALLRGRTHVTGEDVQALAKPVLRHRLVLSFTAESEGLLVDDLVDRLLGGNPHPGRRVDP